MTVSASPSLNAPTATPAWDQLPNDLPPVALGKNGLTILERRYLKRDPQGQPTETPAHLFWRTARFIAEADHQHGASQAQVDTLARQFFGWMTQGIFLPNSPTLLNAGRPLGQLSACFVLPVEDALSNGASGIYDSLTAMALIHQSGGGTGFSFSRLRAQGAPVRSSAGVASGPVSFMRLYNASTDVVKQGGTRRGANMGILRVDHPDIRAFIGCKADTRELTNFNVSVAITDAFMEALQSQGTYSLRDPRSGEVIAQESAQEIWDEIVEKAWTTGEPGLFFIDRANRDNPVPHLGAYEATNPCGEQPLLPYDVCNLGSINVGHFARPSQPGTPDQRVDWPALAEVVSGAVHFLDNVIEANTFPLPAIAARAKEIRRIGLGVMGWADLLVRLGVPYDSEEAISLAGTLMSFLQEHAVRASEGLATDRGVFPEWTRSIWGPEESCARDPQGERLRPERAIRHCNLSTVAPTGSISMIAGCSGGIEPHFALAFQRNQAGVRMTEVNADFLARARGEGWYSDALIADIAQTGELSHPAIPHAVKRTFVTSHHIAPRWHVRMQAAFQEFTDAAISKTTNFPQNATRDQVREIFELAYSLGTKGVTVYRDGSRPEQVLSTGKTEAAAAEPASNTTAPTAATPQAAPLSKRRRPDVLRGLTIKKDSPLGALYLTVNEDADGAPFEVFCTVGKAGGAANADTEAIGRLMSLALRHGVPLSALRDQLRGISCDRAVGFGPNKVLSGPDGIAQALDQYMALGQATHVPAPLKADALASCPDCGSGHLAFQEGCMRCHSCGYSACG